MSYVRDLFLAFAIVAGILMGSAAGRAPEHSYLFQQTYYEVCDLVSDHYFEESEFLVNWVRECQLGAKNFSRSGTLQNLMDELDTRFREFTVSHLSLWDPLALRSQWLGESRETGLRARVIDGHVVITQLVEGGPAILAGLKVGDEIITINDEHPTEWAARSTPGRYTVLRQGKSLVFNVMSAVIRIDERPEFELVGDDVGILTIHSFIPAYFDKEEWLSIIQAFLPVKKVVIDVRGNAGGNFAAMLRALSPFFCHPTVVGHLKKPRVPGDGKAELEDSLDPEYQQQLIEKQSEIELKTYGGYPCFEGDVVVLVDNDSASTTEAFAQSFMKRPRSRVMGDYTAGEVVQAVWHPLSLGSGYAVSIPDSMFYDSNGQSLEGVGVRPQKILEYDLDEARRGIDSWIQDSL